MIQDRYNHLSSQFDKLKQQMDEKVCLEDFVKYTSKIASEYATLQMLDLSIQSIETKILFYPSNSQMKDSIVTSRVKQQHKQTQVFQYQHTIEQQFEERLSRFRKLITSQVRQFFDQVQAQDISKPFREQISNNINSNIQSANITENDKLNQNALLLKKCEQIRISLQEFFGQNKQKELIQQQSQQFNNSNKPESKIQNRPLSVGCRNTKLRRQSATPKMISSSFSGSSAEPQFFLNFLQNPLVQKLKK
ncbi:unnamed protein product [Paramecium pentaurelia]|uniref:Uncharacterized protein n=1 Tax=Paramecium pentaurelia TaxID=43138 RepID=A0A8S1TGW8_9CILI|nr:unnamed protein product [Paramecium pentaurelia]